jgi:hypothetical protein
MHFCFHCTIRFDVIAQSEGTFKTHANFRDTQQGFVAGGKDRAGKLLQEAKIWDGLLSRAG